MVLLPEVGKSFLWLAFASQCGSNTDAKKKLLCFLLCRNTSTVVSSIWVTREREKEKFLTTNPLFTLLFWQLLPKVSPTFRVAVLTWEDTQNRQKHFFPNISDSTWMHSESLRFSFVRTVKCSPSLRVWNCKVMWVADRQAARLDSTAFTSIY